MCMFPKIHFRPSPKHFAPCVPTWNLPASTNRLKTILVTSTAPGEGKSTIAVNLAAVVAQGERRVVLLDTDLRRPTIHRHLQIANRRGLTDLFRDSIKIGSVTSTWGEPPITIITSGGLPPNPSELMASARMESYSG